MSGSDDNFVLQPFRVLGVEPSATEAELRARYLELIKRYPPEHSSGKFEEIQAAYHLAIDPMKIAGLIISGVSPREDVTLESLLLSQKDRPPKMPAQFVLSLGNRSVNAIAKKVNPAMEGKIEQGE